MKGPHKLVCIECQDVFWARSSNHTLCSDRCRLARRKARDKRNARIYYWRIKHGGTPPPLIPPPLARATPARSRSWPWKAEVEG